MDAAALAASSSAGGYSAGTEVWGTPLPVSSDLDPHTAPPSYYPPPPSGTVAWSLMHAARRTPSTTTCPPGPMCGVVLYSSRPSYTHALRHPAACAGVSSRSLGASGQPLDEARPQGAAWHGGGARPTHLEALPYHIELYRDGFHGAHPALHPASPDSCDKTCARYPILHPSLTLPHNSSRWLWWATPRRHLGRLASPHRPSGRTAWKTS